VILLDVGNTRAHLSVDGVVEHLPVDEAIARYHARHVHYINVNPHHTDALSAIAGWHDLDGDLHLPGDYPTMGVDRRALCLAHEEGIFIDAGSAITVDKVENGHYQGGFILPGLAAYRRMYTAISPVLDVPLEPVALDALPTTTQTSVNFGTMAPIIAIINTIRDNLPLYITGGDGQTIATYFDNATYDETLVFQGMQTAIKRNKP